MGKQKSFIIVSSTFLAVILILILIPVFTKGIKDSKCEFESDKFLIEIGSDRGIAPVIYASDKVNNLDFTYEVEDKSIVDVQLGTYSKGPASIFYWVFNEVDAAGKELKKETNVQYNESDKVSIIDGYWTINDKKTEFKAEQDYKDSDIKLHASKSATDKTVECFILNGIQTEIPYDKETEPVRDEATGNWFINGKDTGITYKGIQATIKGLALGETKITIKGTIKKEEISATTTIKVCLPDPTGIKNPYIDNTIVVNKGNVFDIDYEVTTHKDAIMDACQDVIFGKPSKTDIVTFDKATNKYTAVAAGMATAKVKVSDSSFNLGKTHNYYTKVTIIVLDTTDEQIKFINDARLAIEAIGNVVNTPECKALIDAARAAVNKVLEENIKGITNLNDLVKAEEKFASFNH